LALPSRAFCSCKMQDVSAGGVPDESGCKEGALARARAGAWLGTACSRINVAHRMRGRSGVSFVVRCTTCQLRRPRARLHPRTHPLNHHTHRHVHTVCVTHTRTKIKHTSTRTHNPTRARAPTRRSRSSLTNAASCMRVNSASLCCRRASSLRWSCASLTCAFVQSGGGGRGGGGW